MPQVSVIMPVYNTAQYLDEAVRSILSQTLTDFEFIIIDDGSTDGSAKILDGYSSLITHHSSRMTVIHQANSGIAASLNLGIEMAKGKYIARMDSDDISLPDRLAKQVAFMDEHPQIGVCGTACTLFGDASGVTKPRTQSDEIKTWLLFGPCFSHPTVMMRRDLILEHGLRYDPVYEKAEDYELWLRFSRVCELANIPEPLIMYRVHSAQVTTHLNALNTRVSTLIQRLAIESLGIEPTVEEMQLHASLRPGGYETTREYVRRAEAWLLKLIEANAVGSFHDQRAFAAVLFEFWRSLLTHEASLGPWMFWKFLRSRLAFARPVTAVSFAMRVAASRMLDRMPAHSSLITHQRQGVGD